MPLLIYELPDHLGQHVNRVGHRPPVQPRVQVAVRPRNLHFHVAQPTQPYGHRGDILGQHPSI